MNASEDEKDRAKPTYGIKMDSEEALAACRALAALTASAAGTGNDAVRVVDIGPDDVACFEEGNLVSCQTSGVGYNNVCYVLTFEIGDGTVRKYALRISGNNSAGHKTEHEAALLSALRQTGKFPVPRVLAACLKKEGSPLPDRCFILMDCVEGIWLDDPNAWERFDLETKRRLVRDLTHIWCDIRALRFASSGCFRFADGDGDEGLPLAGLRMAPDVDTGVPPCASIREYYRVLFDARLGELEAADDDSPCAVMRPLLGDARRLREAVWGDDEVSTRLFGDGTSDDCPFVLSHIDFELRNVFVAASGPEYEAAVAEEGNTEQVPADVTVTAVLDWEFAGAFPPERDFQDSFNFLSDSDPSLRVAHEEVMAERGEPLLDAIPSGKARQALDNIAGAATPWRLWHLTMDMEDQRAAVVAEEMEAFRSGIRLYGLEPTC